VKYFVCNWRACFAFVLWVALVSGGFRELLIYSNAAGVQKDRGTTWPESSKLVRDSDLATLVVFGHPQCPCSRATVGELERLLIYTNKKIKSHVVFVKPKGQTEDWTKQSLWERASTLHGVAVAIDEEGVEAERFGATTSGQVYLYDKAGMLVFRGGITPARGHMGDSRGRGSILTFVETGKTDVSTADVFGCSLAKPERAIAMEDL
jgi:hypothetical protein